MCECRVTNNYFIHSVGMHFTYTGDDAEWRRRYARELPSPGPSAEELLAELRAQRAKRLRAPAESLERAARIEAEYTKRHPEVYKLDAEKFFSVGFLKIVETLRAAGRRPSLINAAVEGLKAAGLLTQIRPGLFSFEVLTEGFCDLLEEELRCFRDSGLPRTAPNTMNNHGVILSELGFGPGLMDPFVCEYLDAIAGRLLPFQTEGLDSYRAFTVLYDLEKDGDRDLALHYDNAEVTLNVNIGGEWEGGQVAFYGLATENHKGEEPIEVELKRGHGVLHAGLDMHKALPITAGRRHNLIIWCRSSSVRNDRCPMCFLPPRVIPTNMYMHEGFTSPPCDLSSAGDGAGQKYADVDEDLYS